VLDDTEKPIPAGAGIEEANMYVRLYVMRRVWLLIITALCLRREGWRIIG
jgi:hypothetical protein